MGLTTVYFTPVVKITTSWLFLATVAIHYLPLHQLDVKNAFLHGDLEGEIYMEQPFGFVAQGEFGLVCKSCCSLYGMNNICLKLGLVTPFIFVGFWIGIT